MLLILICHWQHLTSKLLTLMLLMQALFLFCQQCQILRLIPKLFSRLLGDADIVIHQLAMEVFENFAQKTTHESLVPDSLNGNEQLRQKFISYIKQVSQVKLWYLIYAMTYVVQLSWWTLRVTLQSVIIHWKSQVKSDRNSATFWRVPCNFPD